MQCYFNKLSVPENYKKKK